MFAGLTKKAFDDPDFKEDAVREVVLAPMLVRLGYAVTGSTRVIRSKSLKHPFIRIGTRSHPVNIIPDYTLIMGERAVFILDAKGPAESVLDPAHVQQAYSYAMHPEVACREFGLCNGRQLAIYDVFHANPLLLLDFEDFELRWNEIEKYLSPAFLANPARRRFAPDFGLAVMRMGLASGSRMTMFGVALNTFGRMSDQLYTASANTELGPGEHCVSFDFAAELLPAVVSGLPEVLASQFVSALNRAPFQASAGLAIELDIDAVLGEVTVGRDEEFVPIVIKRVLASRFNPAPTVDEPGDVPDHIFQLRKAFRVVGSRDA
jgi:hypothetical protein